MSVAKLASQIAKREGKKSQTSIGNIREALKVLVQLEAEFIENLGADVALIEGSPLDQLATQAMKVAQRLAKKKAQ